MSIFICIFTIIISFLQQTSYQVELISYPNKPIIAYLDNNTAWQQSFNPSYLASCDNIKYNHNCINKQSGLIVRVQNCTSQPAVHTACNKHKQGSISYVAFSKSQNTTSFHQMDKHSVIFEPEVGNDNETFGVEDPVMTLDSKTGIYHLLYIAYGPKGAYLSHASSKTPTVKNSQKRHGIIFPDIIYGKGGAILLDNENNYKWQYKYYMYLAVDGKSPNEVIIACSNDLQNWNKLNVSLFKSRGIEYFDSKFVNTGPSPLKLSNGNYVMFQSGIDEKNQYRTGYVIIDGNDPTKIISRSNYPLLDVIYGWQIGIFPYLENTPNVIFINAAIQEGNPNVNIFRLYYGAADDVVGTAVVKVHIDEKEISF